MLMGTKRVALVIGNSNYGDGNMVSGVEDAKAMADCLKGIGFLVPPELVVVDGKLDKTKQALDAFQVEIADASSVVFFYSGHGFQLQGKNFLLPVGGTLNPAGALAVEDVIQRLAAAPNAVKFVFLDACRDIKNVGPEILKGLANPGPAVPGVIQSFATSPGQLAASGSADGLSPYTMALLKYLPQPGLGLQAFFDKVNSEVHRPQQPIIQTAQLPEGFFFRDPVSIQAMIPGGHSTLLVFLNGDLVLETSQETAKSLRLNAGDNQLVLLVSNGRTHRNNHDWDITEGWSYQLDLAIPGISSPTIFQGQEDIPFKDGPHFGAVFKVAQAKLHVDEQTAKVTVLELKDGIANSEAPFFAQDQDVLFQASIADLKIAAEDVFSAVGDLGNLAAILKPFLAEILKSGTILGTKIADPTKTMVTVLGNKALKNFAVICMGNRADRLRDLQNSIAAAFHRQPTPFEIFDQGLMACMRATAQSLKSPIQPENIRIWTALEDNSQESAAPVDAVAASPVGAH
jgi:hypothetical protein